MRVELPALKAEIGKLLKDRNAILLAHNYQRDEIQEIADITGDSLGLSQEAAKTTADVIVFCGVHFMAESAAILSPGKTVLLPREDAGCPMADMITGPDLAAYREAHPGAVVVTYVNSSAEVKALSDVCCTSGNAVNVVKSIPAGKEIFMVPDRNLAQWVAKVSGRPLTWWDGYCPTHERLTVAATVKAKEAHPECREDVLALADEICSTTGMMAAVARHPGATTFIIATEWGLIHQLKKRYPDKEFIVADGCIGCRLHCPYMKMNDLEGVRRSLRERVFEIRVDPQDAAPARRALERMMAVPRDR